MSGQVKESAMTKGTDENEKDEGEDPRNLSQESEELGEEDALYFRSGSTSPVSFSNQNSGLIPFRAVDDDDLQLESTTPRVASTNSLYGEDLVTTRHDQNELLLSPLQSPSEATTPPSYQANVSLSPPLLHTNENMSYSSKASAHRLPPRAPHVAPRFSTGSVGSRQSHQQQASHGSQRPQQHVRVSSGASDHSVMSALTDSTLDGILPLQQPPPLKRSLNTSWDGTHESAEHDRGGRASPFEVPPGLQQPILDDDLADQTEKPPQVIAAAAPPPTHQRKRTLDALRKHLSANIVTDAETEAETLLLQAIEDELREKPKETLFPSIPDTVDAQALEIPLNERDPLASVTAEWMALQGSLLEKQTLNSPGKNLERREPPHAGGAGDRFVADVNALMAGNKSRRRVSQKPESRVASGDTKSSVATNSMYRKDGMETELELDVEAAAADGADTSSAARKATRRNPQSMFSHQLEKLKMQMELAEEYLEPRKASIKGYIGSMLSLVIFPSLCLAFFLFYVRDNPPTGVDVPESDQASSSWWILFIGVRHVLVFSLAKGASAVLVSVVNLSGLRLGPWMKLLIVQSKGWPCTMFFYSLFCMMTLFGGTRFANHWLYWQSLFDMCNKKNPAGEVTKHWFYRRFLLACLTASATTSLKRVWVGYYFGARICKTYKRQLNDAITSMLLLSKVAFLGLGGQQRPPNSPLTSNARGVWKVGESDITTDPLNEAAAGWNEESPGAKMGSTTPRQGVLAALEVWEEPHRDADSLEERTSIKEIVRFRNAYSAMETDYPFSLSFGLANTREACVNSSRRTYDRLLRLQGTTDVLYFDTIALVAKNTDGTVEDDTLHRLYRLFRPDKDGRVAPLDFIKSIDSCYREVRTLSARIRNSTAIDRAYEGLLNVAFFIVLGSIVLSMLGIDAVSFILGITGLIVGFAFMISGASSSYFEGVLMVLVRRPYDVGDIISIDDVMDKGDKEGSTGWLVENIDLYTTTLRYQATREVATVTNGSLARMRIINMRRSDHAQVMLFLKFAIDVPLRKINICRKAVEQFVKDRPREWSDLLAFRATRVESELGYVEYVVIAKHRESWQKFALVRQSKAGLSSFCVEIQKKLEIKYSAPSLPVALNMEKSGRDVLDFLGGQRVFSATQEDKNISDPDEIVDFSQISGPLDNKKTR